MQHLCGAHPQYSTTVAAKPTRPAQLAEPAPLVPPATIAQALLLSLALSLRPRRCTGLARPRCLGSDSCADGRLSDMESLSSSDEVAGRNDLKKHSGEFASIFYLHKICTQTSIKFVCRHLCVDEMFELRRQAPREDSKRHKRIQCLTNLIVATFREWTAFLRLPYRAVFQRSAYCQ
jgi:hypothetical protein